MKRIFAVCGKGGVGKTAVTAMLAEVFAKNASTGRLLIIDADPALGLTTALGMDVEKTIGNVREAIINAARKDDGKEIEEVADMLDYMIMEALMEKENYSVLAMGRSEAQGCFCPVNNLLKDSITMLSKEFDTIIIDGEAGLEQINRQIIDKLDRLIIITDGSKRGLDTVKLLNGMVRDEHIIKCQKTGIIFNRVMTDIKMLGESVKGLDIELLGFVPQDVVLAEYDMQGKSLSLLPKDNPATQAVNEIFKKLII